MMIMMMTRIWGVIKPGLVIVRGEGCEKGGGRFVLRNPGGFWEVRGLRTLRLGNW